MSNAIRVEIPLIPGLRQDVNRFSGAPIGTLRTADNVRFDRTGDVVRRKGHVTDVEIATADSSAILAPRGDLAIWNNDGKVYYGPLASGQSQNVGFFPTLRPLQSRGTFTADSYAYPSEGLPTIAVTSTGYELLAFAGQEGSSGTRYVHFQHRHPDGRTLSSGTLSVSSSTVDPAPRAVAMGDDIILCYRTSATQIQCYQFLSSGSTNSGTVTHASLDSWDISPWTSTRWMLASCDGTSVIIRRMSGVATVVDSDTETPSFAPTAISVYATSTRIYVGLAGASDSGRVLVCPFPFASGTEVVCWTSDTGGGELPPSIGAYEGTDTIVRVVGAEFKEFIDGALTVMTCRYKSGILNGTSFSSDGDSPWNCFPLSKPFGPKGQYTIVDRISDVQMDPDADDSDLKVHRGVLRRDDASARHVWDLSLQQHNRNESGMITGPAWPVTIATDMDGTYLFFDKKIYPRGDIRTAWNAYFEVVGFGRDDVLPELGRGHAQTLDATSVAGQLCDFSLLQAVCNRDASTVPAGIDVGFPTPPGIADAVSHTNGPLEELSTYQFICAYRYHDALSRIHWSAISNKVSVTTGAAEEGITIYATLEDVTRKSFSQDVTVQVYRTAKNSSTFYLENELRGSPLNTGDGCSLYTVSNDDATLVTRELLYTHSRLENQMPPACRYVVHTKNRTWLGGLFRSNIIQASFPRVQNEAPSFNNDATTFQIALPQACTGMASLGDVIIAFAKSGVFAIYGEGPNDRGEGNFSEPQIISLAVGCINARSIVQAEDCVLFQSSRGIEYLGRGLAAPEYIGFPIVDELTARPFVMSSWYNTQNRTAHFVVASAYSATPTDVRILVYDFLAKAWSVDTAVDGTVALGTYAPDVGEILWQKGAGSTGGTMYVESATAPGDGTATYSSTLALHDIYPFGRDGVGIVQLYDIAVLPADEEVITQTLGLDHSTPRSVSWNFTTVTGKDEYRQITPNTSAKCSSVQVTMACSPTATSTQTRFLGGFLWVIGEENAKRLYVSTERQ
jgi:hypothetical protein